MIDLSLQVKGLEHLIETSKSFQRRLPNAVLNGIRRPLRRRLTKIKQRIRRETGIGRNVFGGKGNGSGLDRIVKMIRPKVGDSRTVVTGVRLTGFASLLEQGGRIKPHLIKRAWGRATVKHPGADVRAHYIATQVLNGAAEEIVREVTVDVNKLKQKVFGGEYAA